MLAGCRLENHILANFTWRFLFNYLDIPCLYLKGQYVTPTIYNTAAAWE